MNYLLEEKNIKKVMDPVDLNTAAITGARISLAKGDKVAVLLAMGASVGATVQVTLNQHTAASGGTSKVLTVANPYFHKAGAATEFTKVEPSAASMFDISSVFAANAGVVVFEISGDQLDTDNGYAHFSVDIADSGAAKIGAACYIMSDCRHKPAYAVAL
jgi:hypothetical protein